FAQKLLVDLGIEPTGVPGWLRHDDLFAFTGLRLSKGRGAPTGGGEHEGGAGGWCFETAHDAFVSCILLVVYRHSLGWRRGWTPACDLGSGRLSVQRLRRSVRPEHGNKCLAQGDGGHLVLRPKTLRDAIEYDRQNDNADTARGGLANVQASQSGIDHKPK